MSFDQRLGPIPNRAQDFFADMRECAYSLGDGVFERAPRSGFVLASGFPCGVITQRGHP